MGRSTSCFKIVITCGSDSAANDEVDFSESRSTNDKRGWSFRKRSARHRVLNNTVLSETSLPAKKESPEPAELNFQPDESDVLEKTSSVQCTDEKSQLSAPGEEQRVSETVVSTDAESKHDPVLDDSVVIVIQAAVRGFLAQRELLRHKNVVKLQAAVRGHLVRKQALGTLRCVQAIVKMQALVRTRRARLSLSSSPTEKNADCKDEKDSLSSKTLEKEKENSITKPNETYISIEKLLSNSFARQLMESTPKTKPINIKCDTSKSDSVWNWLERWMSVSSAKQTPKTELMTEQPEKERNENFASPMETIPSEVVCDSGDSKSSVREIVVPSASEENLISDDAQKFNFQACEPTSSESRDDLELAQHDHTDTSDANDISIEINSHQNQIMQSDAASQEELSSLASVPETEGEQLKRSMKRFASDNLETEGKKFVYGSRKVSNPSFIAAQSKFEELSLSTNSGRSINLAHQDVSVDSNVDVVSSGIDTSTRPKDVAIAENSVSKILYGGSECGTELSISSTLDSPDRSEVGNTEYEHETKSTERESCDPDISNNLDLKPSNISTIAGFDESHVLVDQPEKFDKIRGESVNADEIIDSPQVVQKPEGGNSDIHKEPDTETAHQVSRSSPEASPKSHITVPDQGTPSSQVSVKTKSKRTDKSGSNRKRKPLSASKGSPSNANHDSGARSSTEQLARDQKNGKRRNSFGSSRTDNIDQELGDSSSSSSLPHFMQATESARAKIQANNSPRSSPDVQDRDIYIKKRHSLPVANGRQGSPHIQRSTSQVQQAAKGNGTPPLHERKWQR